MKILKKQIEEIDQLLEEKYEKLKTCKNYEDAKAVGDEIEDLSKIQRELIECDNSVKRRKHEIAQKWTSIGGDFAKAALAGAVLLYASERENCEIMTGKVFWSIQNKIKEFL